MTARADVGGPAAGPAAQRAGGDTTTEVIPLAQPVLGPEEEAAVIEVLRSGQLSLGPRVPAFEQAFAAWVGAEHACAVASGTAGLHLSLRAVGVADGDEVVTSPFSFVASANSVLFERARPVFADIDPRTLNLDPDAAAAAVTDRTAALLPVHIFGYPADLPAFERMGLPIVEDACEALGAVHGDGVRVGARGHPAVLRLLRQQAADYGRGRDGHGRRSGHQGAHRFRAQPGPRARHGLARPRPPGLQLPPDRRRVRHRPCPARAPGRHAGRPRAGGRLLSPGAGGRRGARAAVRGRRRRPARLVRVRRAGAARARPRRGHPRAARCAACSASPTCRPSTS